MIKEKQAHFILPESGFRRVMKSSLAKNVKNRDKLLFVVSSLYCYQYRNFHVDYKGFIPLHSSILKKYLGNKSYTLLLKELMHLGMMERSGLYVPTQISRGYRLKEPYRSDKPILVRVKDKIITNKLNDSSIKKERLLTDVDKFLFTNLSRLSFNLGTGLDAIKKDLDAKDGYTEHHFNADYVSIVELADKKYRFTRDSFGNRAHHNLTNMRGSLKKHLYVDHGLQLIGIDIANSQPFLFNVILKKMYPNEMPEDARKYIDLTSKGQFYNYLKIHLSKNKSPNQIKKEFFGKVFFSRNFIYGRKNANDYTQFMEKHFPSVLKVIWHCKRKDHRELPKALQQIESHIIIETVAGSILAIDSETFCLTIHDEILTTESELEMVQNELLKGFDQFDLKPLIRLKKYC